MLKHLFCWFLWAWPLWSSAQVPATDSVTQTTSAASAAAAIRYVNATSLTLRARPATTAPALATIQGASRVQLYLEQPDGWSQVRVATHTGYVKSEYLVEEQAAVTAAVDWTEIEAAGGPAYSQVVALPPAAPAGAKPTHRPSSHVAVGPQVYVCGNGRTEVYHRSESCAAMRRCTYQTLVMSQREAQAAGLRGCMKCD